MHRCFGVMLLLVLSACGGSATGTPPDRYNFAVVDGLNQTSTAGAPTLAKPITSQLARDPNGKYAFSIVNWLAPAVAFAQSLAVPGTPVPNQLVCGEETGAGEPKVVPLCAFTLADGKAPNTVQGGTKAGVYTMRFTAQVPTEMPVKDSTTVTVEAGTADPNYLSTTSPYSHSPAVVEAGAVQDQYGNPVPFRVVTDGRIQVKSVTTGDVDARTIAFDASLYDNLQDHVVELRGVGDAVVGHLRYRIGQGPDGQPQIFWITGGVNRTP